MAFLQHYCHSFIQLILLVDCVCSAPALPGRPSIARAAVQQDEQHPTSLFSRRSSPTPEVITSWVFGIVLFAVLLLFVIIPVGASRGFMKRVRGCIRRRGCSNSGDDGFNALKSTTSEIETSYDLEQDSQQSVLLPTLVAQTPSAPQLESGETAHRAQFQSPSMPAPTITVTPTNPNFSPQMHSAGNTPGAPVRHNSWTPEPDAPQPSKMPAGSCSGPPPRGVPSSSSLSPSSPSFTPADISYQSQIYLQTAPEVVTPRASSPRLKPIRTALTPSPRSSVDITSMNDRSPSLAEFPVPPPRPSSYSANILSPLVYSPGDLGTPRNIQSPTSPPGVDTPNIIDEDPALPSSRRGESPEYGPPSTTSTRPPTYYGSWHRSTPSQSSFATLPAYSGIEEDGDGDGRLSRISRAPTYRSSITSLRGPRTPRTRPPLPVPPLPSDLPK